MVWSHNGVWLVTTDDRGLVKYWQSNFNNVHTFQAHADPVKSSRWEFSDHVTRFITRARGVSNELCTCFNALFMGNIDKNEIANECTLCKCISNN